MSENKVIIPTIGRRVWFRPPTNSAQAGFVCIDESQPMDAGIVFVWSERMVNLDVTDHAGNHHAFTSVALLQDDDAVPAHGRYAQWMPYQKGQASKPDDIKALVATALGELLKPGPIELMPTAELRPDGISTMSLSMLGSAPGNLYCGDGTVDRLGDLTFGRAIALLKAGKRVTRLGWNGKGMFVYYVPPASYPVQTGAAKEHFGEGSMVPYNAYLAIKTVEGPVSTWVPGVNDCLAEDWVVVL
ncbi:DUF2829 domain-containing protein [Variovorax sp. LjRoot175]|uniref:DUF2829 domain-containing protein n=1 Tax=Variovorax sp. LjRoot175 TaxID=3342276 RepID=UPI003ED0963F